MVVRSKFQLFLIFSSILLLLPVTVYSRNVSYTGGWTIMQAFNDDSFSILTHYTLNPTISVGYRYEYFRDRDWHLNAVQANALLKRWNMPDAQANIYAVSGLGTSADASNHFFRSSQGAAFAGIEADWENRQYFIAYTNRYLHARGRKNFFNQKARVGFAPYIGEFDDVHTWIMLEVDHHTRRDTSVAWTPMARFFKGPFMLELGWTIRGGPLTNVRILF